MVQSTQEFDYIKIKLASPFRMLQWANRRLPNGQFVGEVQRSDTINYRTFKPEMDGLFCERIFGPSKSLECACGKYKRIRYEGLVCEKCGVELTESRVRRHRMGYINLIYPVVHVWYINSRPNYMSLLLEVEQCEQEPNVQRVINRPMPARPKKTYKNVKAYCVDWAYRQHRIIKEYYDPEKKFKAPKITRKKIAQFWDERIQDLKLASIAYFIAENQRNLYRLHIEFLQYRKIRNVNAPLANYPRYEFDPRYSRPPQNYEYKEIEDDEYDADYAVETGDFLNRYKYKPVAEINAYEVLTNYPVNFLSTYEYKHPNRITKRFVKMMPNFLVGSTLIKRQLDKLDLQSENLRSRQFMVNCIQILNLRQQKQIEPHIVLLPWEIERIDKLRLNCIKRIRILENLIGTGSRPSWMIFSILPVIPPALRPMIQLDGGRFATSDLNELYRRIITRNNRLLRLLEVDAPQVVIRNEKRLLQESIDTLIDNGKRGRIALSANNRPLKSLSDIIKGKYGRFRQNLLGKRVDYSGRSVIVVGPSLKLNQCGLPYEMVLELFQPFIIRELINEGLASNMTTATTLMQKEVAIVVPVVEQLLKSHPIFINRAPTLHRLGIQAFEPILVQGRAIKLHPLVCAAFNADFDGDQMAVHIPLSVEAQAECYMLMLAPYNFLSPANGEPIITPSQDMVLGCYYLTVNNINGLLGSSHYFGNLEDVILAYNQDQLEIHSSIWIRHKDDPGPLSNMIKKVVLDDGTYIEHYENLQIRKTTDGEVIVQYLRTTTGRVIFNYTIQQALNFL